MSDIDDVFSYVFTWHSLSNACKKCLQLDGREWRDQDLMANTLWAIPEGRIWDLDADHSLAHPNCRCQLEVRVEVDITKLPEYVTFQEMLDRLRI